MKKKLHSRIFHKVIAQLKAERMKTPLYLIWYINSQTWGTLRADINKGFNAFEVEKMGQNFKEILEEEGKTIKLISW